MFIIRESENLLMGLRQEALVEKHLKNNEIMIMIFTLDKN